MRKAASASLLLLLLATLGGCAQGYVEESGDAVLDSSSGRAYELHLRLKEGAEIEVEWRVLAPNATVAFDVHRHAGPDVVTLAAAHGSSFSQRVTADADGDFFLYWHSPSVQPLGFEFQVRGRMEVVGGDQG